MKEKGIRQDIIESSSIDCDLNKIFIIFTKANKLNKVIEKQIGIDLIENYKRASNILNLEINLKEGDYIGSADPHYLKTILKKIY